MSAPAQDVHVEPLLREYSVGDVINCSANGWPAPRITWQWVSGPEAGGASDGRALTVSDEMKGETNKWKCVATNSFGSDELLVVFNVTGELTMIDRSTWCLRKGRSIHHVAKKWTAGLWRWLH